MLDTITEKRFEIGSTIFMFKALAKTSLQFVQRLWSRSEANRTRYITYAHPQYTQEIWNLHLCFRLPTAGLTFKQNIKLNFPTELKLHYITCRLLLKH
jgi:hypothetical protein